MSLITTDSPKKPDNASVGRIFRALFTLQHMTPHKENHLEACAESHGPFSILLVEGWAGKASICRRGYATVWRREQAA